MSDILKVLGVKASFRCECLACGGTGECPDCEGDGETDTSVLPDNHEHAGELGELARDMKRLERECIRLCEMKPEHTENYKAQLAASQETVRSRAKELLGLNTAKKEKTEP